MGVAVPLDDLPGSATAQSKVVPENDLPSSGESKSALPPAGFGENLATGLISAGNSAAFGLPEILTEKLGIVPEGTWQEMRDRNKAATTTGDIAGMFVPLGGGAVKAGQAAAPAIKGAGEAVVRGAENAFGSSGRTALQTYTKEEIDNLVKNGVISRLDALALSAKGGQAPKITLRGPRVDEAGMPQMLLKPRALEATTEEILKNYRNAPLTTSALDIGGMLTTGIPLRTTAEALMTGFANKNIGKKVAERLEAGGATVREAGAKKFHEMSTRELEEIAKGTGRAAERAKNEITMRAAVGGGAVGGAGAAGATTRNNPEQNTIQGGKSELPKISILPKNPPIMMRPPAGKLPEISRIDKQMGGVPQSIESGKGVEGSASARPSPIAPRQFRSPEQYQANIQSRENRRNLRQQQTEANEQAKGANTVLSDRLKEKDPQEYERLRGLSRQFGMDLEDYIRESILYGDTTFKP